MTRIDRRALFASGAAAALLAATGVSASPQRGGRLRAALSSPLFDQAVAATVYDNLTEIAADGTLRGELATDWSSDASARRWRFTLREGVSFHDGTLFEASHVQALPMTVEVIDARTVDIVLETANPNLPYLLAHPGYEIRSESGAGTGLYTVQKLDQGRHFIGTRVADHWKEQAGWFDSAEFVHFSADAVRAEALRDGLVDVADITALDPLANPRDFQTLPGGQVPTHIAANTVAVPMSVGKSWPLDNLRMAERWWMG
ncbi:ABC transporter substrate-binding protein [uncultured Tateyamaria sp.]|uniref:ABC transporter substrate-binding protein n=1 Tax=uncultured Tateyamaria sp. TaxID=455651 RepID=UPI00262D7C2E|nr:ABC transporter substrate-binding protein [uncultured Tateyamaria sp.]